MLFVSFNSVCNLSFCCNPTVDTLYCIAGIFRVFRDGENP